MALFLVSTLAVALILFPLDVLWLGWLSRGVYQRELGALLLAKPRLAPAAAFYLSFVAGIAFFAIMPNLSGPSWMAALYGAALGFIVYGGYDAVNRATMKDFTRTIMLIDWTWGTMLTAISAGLGHALVAAFWR